MTVQKIDLTTASLEELNALMASVSHAVADRQKAKREEVMAQIEELARSIGGKATVEFADEKPKVHGNAKREVAAKYRNPSNENETWTGRGLQPKWMQELIASGRNKDEFLIAA